MHTWTIPIRYSNQDFDEVQHRATQLTDADRAAGRPAPPYGYSAENVKRADEERREAVASYNAKSVVTFVDVSTITEYGMTQKLSNSVRVF